MKVLDLFSGIGGFSLGLEAVGFETIAFCEIEKYPQKVLAKNWPKIPIANDVTKLTYKNGALYDNEHEIYNGSIEVICGGFPCQDISVAAKIEEGHKRGKGIDGERSGLWSECARLLSEIRPKYAIFENVTALLSGDEGRWFQSILWQISEIGYDAEWHCIPASELGANHHRDRIWIIAYPCRQNVEGHRELGGIETRLSEERQPILSNHNKGGVKSRAWENKSTVCRMADGIPDWSHRIKSLGNAVCPPVVELIGKKVIDYEFSR